MAAPDVHGPVDTVILEFPSGATGVQAAAALRDLVDEGVIHLFDLMVVRRDGDGSCREVAPTGEAADVLGTLAMFAGARSGLLDADDLDDLARVLEPGTTGVVLIYENAWAVPFVAAARSEGAELVASMRLTAQEIMDALDAVDVTA